MRKCDWIFWWKNNIAYDNFKFLFLNKIRLSLCVFDLFYQIGIWKFACKWSPHICDIKFLYSVFLTDVFLILQGDDLIHFCKYETMDRDKLVQASAISEPSKSHWLVSPRVWAAFRIQIGVGFLIAVTPLSIPISSDCNKNMPSLIFAIYASWQSDR